MKKITFISLFFCLSITTILAQVVTTNIETPNSNRLSNNQVDDFDVNTDGTILNNSASDGTAQLGATAVTGNGNITAGSEASLILFQVTSTSNTSDLNGQIEVFGGEAGLIIANPNGITCDGCGFINTNKVDLVTGSGYNASTNSFGNIATTNISVVSGGLDASSVAVLNIQTGANFYNENATINANEFNVTAGNNFHNQFNATINANEFNVTAGDDFINRNSSTINANNFHVTAGGGNIGTEEIEFFNYAGSTINADNVTIEVTNFANNISNVGTISSDSLNLILTDDFTRSSGSFAGFNNFSNLTVTTEGTFTNNDTIILAGDLEITANSFTNTGRVVADTFNLSGAGDFDYVNSGNITANAFNLTVDGNFSNNNANSNFTWGNNYSLNVSGNADITVYSEIESISSDISTINIIKITSSRKIECICNHPSSISKAICCDFKIAS